MATPKQPNRDLTDAEFDALLRAIPPDLESTPEEDAEDIAAFERDEEQLRQGRWTWFEDLDRKYSD